MYSTPCFLFKTIGKLAIILEITEKKKIRKKIKFKPKIRIRSRSASSRFNENAIGIENQIGV